ncbi:hypothetical protein U8527_11875 [Kordia algicida OT-1]|uniref:Uncharacterized protein n=1 Tax=Kordia algicida OT-1 TaxID=391587 RepID=A9E092_9FLAO|nr:hypothetical protein [Kordia algicida]EDP95814.1 hypothetical protein KAOT1_05402 [Kordia algicida OT-1]
MRKAIIDFKKVTPEIYQLLQERYPGGYRDRDIIVFDDHHNNTIEAVEVKTEDTIYLVKVSSKLHYTMTNVAVDDFEEITPDENLNDFSEE